MTIVAISVRDHQWFCTHIFHSYQSRREAKYNFAYSSYMNVVLLYTWNKYINEHHCGSVRILFLKSFSFPLLEQANIRRRSGLFNLVRHQTWMRITLLAKCISTSTVQIYGFVCEYVGTLMFYIWSQLLR